jgi:presenilin-like A22 family membrane protease
MKHTVPVTVILVCVFIFSQLLGLFLINKGVEVSVDENGNRVVSNEDTALGPRPETRGFQSFVYLIVGLAVGTLVLLVLVRFKLVGVWKIWFFLAVAMASTVSLGALLPTWVAAAVALVLAVWKIWRPNMYVHNITEVLVYSGIGLLVVPILDLLWVSILLIVIAIYDAYAVWRSRHMVKMAQFQTESKLFAGLVVPYKTNEVSVSTKPKTSAKKVDATPAPQEAKTAILGGGDIAFPLLFTGVVMNQLIQEGMSKLAAYGYSLIIVLFAALALLGLFLLAKKDRFYPAMPPIVAGCFIGFGILKLVLMAIN